jgi:hypothetical protein
VKRERIDGKKEKEKEALANLKREKGEEEMRYFWCLNPINILSHAITILPLAQAF